MGRKRILMIAGPNGAGKTTFACSFLPVEANVVRFLNADLIAAGLSPFAPEAEAVRAARLMLEEVDGCVARGESFAIETTLSGKGYLKHIARWKALGYRVTLYFLTLPNAEMAMARVASRVSQGGHHIPDDVVRRRHASGWFNFEHHYRDAVDDWMVFDNRGNAPVMLDWKENP